MYLTISLSFYLPIYLSTYLFTNPSIYLSVYLSFCLSISLSLLCLTPLQHLNFKKWSEPLMFLTFWLENVLRATATCNFLTCQVPKVARDRQFFKISNCKCAWRHSGVPLFDMPISKNGPRPSVFLRFWVVNALGTTAACHLVAVEWYALYSTFWLTNVLGAKAVCNFSYLPWTHGSAAAALRSLLFDPADPQINGKTQHFATSPNISRMCIFFLLTFAPL